MPNGKPALRSAERRARFKADLGLTQNLKCGKNAGGSLASSSLTTMMSPKATNFQCTTSNVTVPGGRITVKVLEFLFKPLLKAQWQAGYEIGCAQAEAWNVARRQRIALEHNCGGDVLACMQYEHWLLLQRTLRTPVADENTNAVRR